MRRALLLPLLVAASASAQEPPWGVTLATSSRPSFVGVRPLDDRGMIVSALLAAAPQERTWIARLDADGSVLWERELPAADRPVIARVSSDDAGATCVALSQGLVTRLEADGTIAWTVRLSHRVAAAAPTPAGGCVVAGDMSAPPFVASLDAAGDVEWARKPFPAPHPLVSDVAVMPDGVIVHASHDLMETGGTLQALDASGFVLGERVIDPCSAGGATTERVFGSGGGSVAYGVTCTSSSPSGEAIGRAETWAGRPGGDGLWFQGERDLVRPSSGVAGAQVHGGQVVTKGQILVDWNGLPPAEFSQTRQGHAADGSALWAREPFDGVPAGDGTFIEAVATADGVRVVRRGPEGMSTSGCAPSPAAHASRVAGTPGPWTFSAPVPLEPVTVTSAPTILRVLPSSVTRLPSCGPCAATGSAIDSDSDGIADDCDGCPGTADPEEADLDGDLVGDACDDCNDRDGDGLGEPGPAATCPPDPCPLAGDGDPLDEDGDGLGAACDNCPSHANADQANADRDGAGDSCDTCPASPDPSPLDLDGDGALPSCDTCPAVPNPDQADLDGDGLGDACDCAPAVPNAGFGDVDLDGVCDDADACPSAWDPTNANADGDRWGDACDTCDAIADDSNRDTDRDGRGDACDACPTMPDAPSDLDADGRGDACDNCPAAVNPSQEDADSDVVGDACDNCPLATDRSQADEDGDGVGDACTDLPEVVGLRLSLEGTGLRLRWIEAVAPSQAIHLGTLAAERSGGPDRRAIACRVTGAAADLPMPAGDVVLLVTARAGIFEGSAGRTSAGAEREHDPACP